MMVRGRGEFFPSWMHWRVSSLVSSAFYLVLFKHQLLFPCSSRPRFALNTVVLHMESMTTTSSDHTFLLRAKQFSSPQTFPVPLNSSSLSSNTTSLYINRLYLRYQLTYYETLSHPTQLDLSTPTMIHSSRPTSSSTHPSSHSSLSISDGSTTRHPYSRILTRDCETRVPHVFKTFLC
jgi:hypothetical protein